MAKNQTGKEVVKMYARTYVVCLLTAFVLGAFCQWAYIVSHYELIAY